MFDLDYAQPLTFTSDDMQDFSPGSVITYVCSTTRSKDWSKAGQALYNKVIENENGVYPKEAVKFLGLGLISIEQNGTTHGIGNEEHAAELRDTIESYAIDTGDQYITDLAFSVYVKVMSQIIERKKKSNSAEKD